MTPLLSAALRAATLLRQAYAFKGVGFNAWLAPRAAEAGIVTDGEETTVVMRGSESCVDFLRDLDTRRLYYYPMRGMVHRGFMVHASHLLSALVRELDKPAYEDQKINLVAHSLGAGILPIVLSTLRIHGHSVRSAWSFGAPRMCDEHASSTFDADLEAAGIENYRVVALRNGRQDLVTRVPLSKDGWWHVMRPLIVEDGNVYLTSQEWELVRAKEAVGRIANWRILSRLRAAVGAHGIAWYSRAIEEAIANVKEATHV